MGAFSGMTAILALFLLDRFGIGEQQDLDFLHLYRRPSLSSRAREFWAGRWSDLAKRSSSRIGLVLLATGLGAFPFVHNYVPARSGDRVHPARHRVHLPVRHIAALAGDSEQ